MPVCAPIRNATLAEPRDWLLAELGVSASIGTMFNTSATSTGKIALSPPQLAALLDGCECRAPVPVRRPELAG